MSAEKNLICGMSKRTSSFHATLDMEASLTVTISTLDMCCDCFDKLMDELIPKCAISPVEER